MLTEYLLEEAKRWGIQPRYKDWAGRWRQSPEDSVAVALDELKRLSDRPVDDGSHPAGLTCVPPERSWGWSIQLPSLVSQKSQGIGDLIDLKDFGGSSRTELGAGFVMINPLGAGLPFGPQEPSPYFRSSRSFRDPLYLRLPDGELGVADPLDRDAVYRWKLPRLKKLFEDFDGDPEFESFVRDQGNDLWRFATFQALAESFQSSWRAWPAELKDSSGKQAQQWAAANAQSVRFQCWVQWQIDEQLRDAASHIDLVGDLPVGTDPSGAEAWSWQQSMARGFTVGAPPDEFNTQGQDWGVVPFHPVALALDGYDVFRNLLRASMRHFAGLRIDHVMGLFRLFWIPTGGTPQDGVYVRYPYQDLVAIVAEESRRSGTFVVGEDLGTVEPEVRDVMGERGLLRYRVFWFEEDLDLIDGSSLAAVTTHDLPTIAGVLSGSDEIEQKKLGIDPAEGMKALRQKLSRSGSNDPVLSTYSALAATAAALVSVAIEDALGVEERPNMPGTDRGRSNWSKVLPSKVEEFFDQPMVRELAGVFRPR